jgi:regulator of protease activity HflC (stomatin/prohibitin superfamily)
MTTLILSGVTDGRVDLHKPAIEVRDDALSSASLVLNVSNQTTLSMAQAAISELKAITRATEASRVEIKAIPLRITQAIDSIARQFTAPVEDEIKRLDALVRSYAVQQERLRQEQARKIAEAQAAEQRRIREEAEAERRRLEADAAAKRAAIEAQRQAELAKARSEAEAKAAEQRATAAALRVATDTAAAAQAYEDSAKIEAAAVPELFVMPVAAPLPVKKVWRFEVTSPVNVLKHDPTLLRIEPNTAAINRLIAAGARDIPGLRIYEDIETKIK